MTGILVLLLCFWALDACHDPYTLVPWWGYLLTVPVVLVVEWLWNRHRAPKPAP